MDSGGSPIAAPPRLRRAAVAALGAYVAVLAATSLFWRFTQDAAMQLYLGWLYVEHGYVPYRDTFETSMPGAPLMHALIVAVLGASDMAFRVWDVAWVVAFLAVMWRLMRPFGRDVALVGPLLFAAHYLGTGPPISFQRDFFLLLPPMAAALAATHLRGGFARGFLIGAGAGMAATVKPQAALLALPIAAWQIAEDRAARPGAPWRAHAPLVLGILLGGASVGAVTAAFLAWNGALGTFLDFSTGYMKLYAHLDGSLRPVSAGERLLNIAKGARNLSDKPLWFAAALLGVYRAVYRAELDGVARRRLLLFLGLAAYAFIHVLFQAKFWIYHWLPWMVVVTALSALCLLPGKDSIGRGEGRFAALALLVVALLSLPVPNESIRIATGRGPTPPKHGSPDRIAAWLAQHSRPGDVAQCIDLIGGGAHALLIARLPLATEFATDLQFHHDVDDPKFAPRRRHFVERLAASRARFVVEIIDHRMWPTGPNTTREFPELRALLERDYRVAVEDPAFLIWERSATE